MNKHLVHWSLYVWLKPTVPLSLCTRPGVPDLARLTCTGHQLQAKLSGAGLATNHNPLPLGQPLQRHGMRPG
jgi:hypothetical protein